MTASLLLLAGLREEQFDQGVLLESLRVREDGNGRQVGGLPLDGLLDTHDGHLN